MKKPSSKFFERKTVFEEFKKYKGVRIVSIKTSKQKGDIAGTKTKKFYSFFLYKLKKEFKIKKSGFEYNENENIGCFYLLLEKKENEVVKGPHITKVKHLSNFKKAHPNSFIKNKYSYVKIMHKLSFEEWIKKFLKDEKKIIKEMSITEIKDVR